MDISFHDSAEIPLPPDEVRLRSLQAVLYPDGRRVRVTLTLTPFQKYPNLELAIHDSLGQLLAQTNVIEIVTSKLALTLHLRRLDVPLPYTLSATLFYTKPIESESDSDLLTLSKQIVVDTASCVVVNEQEH